MKRRTPVSRIMTRKIITLNYSDDLNKAETLFKENNIRHIPVVQGSEIKGMLSYTDLLRISFADAYDEDKQEIDTAVYNLYTIDQVMAKDLVSVGPSMLIREVAEILSEKEFHALPVINDNELVGIVTTTDLINYLLEQF